MTRLVHLLTARLRYWRARYLTPRPTVVEVGRMPACWLQRFYERSTR